MEYNKKIIQLFLLPYAGGSSLSFMKLNRFLSPHIEAIAIDYAGRGTRKNEPIIENYSVFCNDVINMIKTKRDDNLPFAIFGYSLGSVIAFDIISNNFFNNLRYCFFCAEGGLCHKNISREYVLLDDTDFKKEILELGGIDKRLLKNERELFSQLKLIKADFKILEQFRYNSSIVKCDASVIYGSNDTTCTNMDDWKILINGTLDYYIFEEGHFFIKHFKEIANYINNKLAV